MEIYLFEKFLVIWIKATDFRICKHQSSKPNSVPVSRVEVIPCFFWIILLQHLQKNLVMTSLSNPPFSQKRGVGGTLAIAHSIRRCRASRVAKASLLPGALPVPPTPFFESHPKKRRSRLHFGAFLHLEDFQFGEKWFFSKILHIAGVLAFFGDLGGIKKSSKKQVNSQKNHGSRKALFWNGFWIIFLQFSRRKTL